MGVTNKNQCREAFEAWLKKHMPHAGLEVDEGQYRSPWEQVAWTGWQAARSAPAAPLSDEQIDALPMVIHLRERIKHWKRESAKRYVEGWNDSAEQEGARSAPAAPVELPEPVTWLIERSAFRVSPHRQDAESNEWFEEAYGPGEQGSFRVYTEQQVRELLAAAPSLPQGWLPIESAPRDKTILLGYRNSHGHWRTLRGDWFSREEIDETWEEPDGVEPGWFETSVEADDVPNVWRTNPTHWMSLPQPPKEQA